jgi:hypothetical protein
MNDANTKMREGRMFDHLGGLGMNMSEEMADEIANVQQTVQFLAHLCTGHNAKFQDFLRVQPMYNVRTYDIVRCCRRRPRYRRNHII